MCTDDNIDRIDRFDEIAFLDLSIRISPENT
jgi:hypothetical protein